jgi:hypothetical protein
MTRLLWDQVGERRYETGVDQGVLYVPTNGVYDTGYAWNGLTTVTEKPSGADSNPVYADNIKYLNLTSAEDFGATVEALTYPDQFAQFDGTAVPSPGVSVGQQIRKAFGLSYRTKVGNDVAASDLGYKLHLVYSCQAAPSEKAYATVNDTPEAMPFSWDITTTPVAVGAPYKPAAILTIDSTKVTPANLTALENALYGTAGTNPRLPLPPEVLTMFAGAITNAVPAQPVYTPATHTIAIPVTTGVDYTIDGVVRTGNVVLAVGDQKVVRAVPKAGYVFPPNTDDDWQYIY